MAGERRGTGKRGREEERKRGREEERKRGSGRRGDGGKLGKKKRQKEETGKTRKGN
jgi:hypothetical protein